MEEGFELTSLFMEISIYVIPYVGNEGIIDIPPEYRDIDAYRASLAHKV